ncbi:hypothetical protein ACMGD3_24155 [Lysinibacillus sphaericus]|uniref:hypothetical protein n=1 Tax=Lysinibacillus sphaericus TaxID=1421 RepID=UPI003F791485
MNNLTTVGTVMNIALVVCTLIASYLALDLYTKRIVTRGNGRQTFSKVPVAEGLLKRIQIRLNLLEIRTNAYDFFMKVVIQSLIIGAVVFLVTLFTLPSIVSLVIAFIVVFTCLIYPIYALDSKVSALQAQREFDLPRFLKMLIALMKTHTPYQALEEALHYTPKSIKPFVEQLILEIEQFPNSSIPYENFSENIGISKARSFMAILQQSMHISPEKSVDFLETLKSNSDTMEKEAIDQLAKVSVGTMQKYKFILFICLFIPPASIVAIIGLDMLKGIM